MTATCEALVNSMLKRVKAVLENNGGQNIDTLGLVWRFSLRGVGYSLLLPAVYTLMAAFLVILNIQ